MPNGGPHPPCDGPHDLLGIAKKVLEDRERLREQNAELSREIVRVKQENAALKIAIVSLGGKEPEAG